MDTDTNVSSQIPLCGYGDQKHTPQPEDHVSGDHDSSYDAAADHARSCRNTFCPLKGLLLTRSEVCSLLALSSDDIDWLCRTRQLPKVTINRNERFHYKDVESLAATYRSSAKRRVA